MRQESEDLEKRIRSLLAQIQSESAILDRIAYKGKNQHRRAFYFQYLLKICFCGCGVMQIYLMRACMVRRDTKLLLSANLEEILNFFVKAVDDKKPSCRLKKRKLMSQKHHFRMRLLGVARLLSQMVEPMVKAAIELSAMLARTFFMAFSVVNLALLARLRVLVQQILLDVVLVFNMISSSSQKEQSAILTFEGVEIFREYHPSDNDVIALECIWEAEKFVLHEKTQKSEASNQVAHVGGGIETPLKPSCITYQAIEAFLGDDDADHPLENLCGLTKERSHATGAFSNQFIEITKEIEVEDKGDDEGQEGSPEKNFSEGGISAGASIPCQKLQEESRKTVAFVTVSPPTPSQMKQGGIPEKEVGSYIAEAAADREDSIFSLLSRGHDKDSLF
ncbi:Calcium-dependent protein kinase [Thalictrum thalictroides]|uniref:Calcium-dependent protein kinase n=1 Tax=Thalictrum thalictroides TaxID=46969 RepID=A0A7J6X9Q8_THATH|nr:Calcium-dependent protein kinase [Thalictrum thalictroides]